MDSQEQLGASREPIAMNVGVIVIGAIVGLALLKRLSIKVNV